MKKLFYSIIISFVIFNITETVFADEVITENVIIQGNLCVGEDCVNGEVFNDDTIKMKRNNVRIYFVDTSSTSSFPTNDWRIEINASVNGGDSYFAIQDADADTYPFKIEAGALDNCLVIDSTGKVGIGTDSPQETLDVSGNIYISGNMELGSSRDYKNNIKPLETKEAFEALRALRPVKYNLKMNPEEDSVGFIAEEVPDLVATNSRKSISPVDIVAVLTKVVQEQEKTIENISNKIDFIEKKLKNGRK